MLLTKIMFKDKLLFFNVQCHWCFRIRIGMFRISLQHFHSLFACRGGCILEGYIHVTIILESHLKYHAMPSYIIGQVLKDYQNAIANIVASTSPRDNIQWYQCDILSVIYSYITIEAPRGDCAPLLPKTMHWSLQISERKYSALWKYFVFASQILKLNSASPQITQNVSKDRTKPWNTWNILILIKYMIYSSTQAWDHP